MKCVICNSDAAAKCDFCGRFVCKEHIQEGPVKHVGVFDERDLGRKEVIAVYNTVWCGQCKIFGYGRYTERSFKLLRMERMEKHVSEEEFLRERFYNLGKEQEK